MGTPETVTDETETLDQQPPAAPPSGTTPTGNGPKVLTIPSHRMKEIKQAERAKGQKDTLAALDAEARKLGFENHEDLKRAAERSRQQPQTSARPAAGQPDRPDGQQQPHGKNGRRLRAVEKENADLKEKLRATTRAASQAEKRTKQLERDLDAKEAEAELRLAAVRAGVQDVDYAVTLVQRAMGGKTEEELDKFDESTYFSTELRKTHPYLFETVVRPAGQPGPKSQEGGSPPPAPGAPPKTQEVLKDAPQNGGINARDLTPDAYKKRLGELGLQDPATATSHAS